MTPPLVGREAELAWLAAAIEDAETPIVIVGGPSGAGKTALVDAALDAIGPGPVVGRARYLDGAVRRGLSPILRALAQIAEGALDLLYEPKAGLGALKATLGDGLDALSAAGFVGDRDFVGPAVMPRALGESETGVRIIDAAARLARWLDGFGVPIILVIDDWQRAPPQAAGLLAAMVRSAGAGSISVVLCERGEQVHPPPALRPLSRSRVLGPIAGAQRAALLGEAFGDLEAGSAIAGWLGVEGLGLPFDLIEIAKGLAGAGALSCVDGAWTVDAARAAALGREDVSAAILQRTRALGDGPRELALALALWGEPAPPRALATALARPPAEIVADAAALRGAGVLATGVALAVAHDRLAAALRAAAPADEQARLAGAMAERLMGQGDADAPAALLALRLAAGLADAAPERWREAFSAGALRARRGADTQAAGDFAEAALRLRQVQPPADPAADRLILEEALLAAASRPDAALVRQRARALLDLTGDAAELAHAYELSIGAARRAGDADQAWDWARAGLAAFKVGLPQTLRVTDLLLAVAAWRLAAAMPHRPPSARDNREMESFASLVSASGAIAFERRAELSFLVALKAATRGRRMGQTSEVWSSADVFVSACLTDYAGAARIARRARETARAAPVARGMSLYRRVFFGDIWTHPSSDLRPVCAQVYDLAIADGDMITAGYALRNDILLGWRTGAQLDALMLEAEEAQARAERLGQANVVASLRTMQRQFQRLTGRDDDFDQPLEQGLVDGLPDSAAPERHGFRMMEIEFAGLLGDWPKVLRLSEAMRRSGANLDSHPGGLAWRFHESLARLRLGRPMPRGALKALRRAAILNPADDSHRPLLLAAEDLRRRGQREQALPLHAEAVDLAMRGASSLEAIVAAQCAADAAQSLGRDETADRYRVRLAARAAEWGWRGRGAPAAGDPLSDPAMAQRLADAETGAAMAARADRAKARLLADVAHELRTPLQGMQGLLDLAGDRQADLGELREVLASLRSVVDDLTDLGAHASGGAALNVKPVDIAGLVRAEAALCAAAAAVAPSRTRLRIDASFPPRLWTDGPRVRQVLRNLLSNAFKYGGDGPVTVTVSAEGESAAHRMVTLRIDDSGPGLGQANLARLFEPFDRGGRDDSRGLGLGLALGRRIAERLGGALTAQDRPEGGACFTFTFEARAEAEPPATAPVAPQRILLVEDVELSRRVMAALLRRQGHDVAEAGDGAAALALVGAQDFDLALVDMGLPDMDGARVLEAMTRDAPGARLVAVTAAAGRETVQRALAAGAASVLIKPVSAADLAAEIGRLLAASPVVVDEAGFAAEMAALTAGADQEIRSRSEMLIRGADLADGQALAAEAHRLAGLAGQFGARDIAAAALRLERDLAGPADGHAEALAALSAALAAFRS